MAGNCIPVSFFMQPVWSILLGGGRPRLASGLGIQNRIGRGQRHGNLESCGDPESSYSAEWKMHGYQSQNFQTLVLAPTPISLGLR